MACSRCFAGFFCFLLMVALPAAALAQSITGMGELPREQQAEPIRDVLESPPSLERRTGTYGPVDRQGLHADDIPPFGANLFRGGFRGIRSSGINPAYRIMPGDQITLRTWGAVAMERVLPVDAQGNIFIPQVGPVQVQGTSAAELNGRVESAIRRVFRDNVSVYTNLQGVQPVAVFVTGFVNSPGLYAGVPSDSLLYFLDQASGIDVASGSFRDIRILRGGRTIATVDLYPFLLSGEIPRPQFEEGDTLVVGPRGPMITVTGDVSQPYRYELDAAPRSGQDLLQWVQTIPGVSHALVRGVRETGPFSVYLPITAFRDESLNAGDEIVFSADQRADTIVVELEGIYEGPSRFALPRDARLLDLLDSIPVNPELAEVRSVSIKRLSVAERQRQSLEDSLRRLETAYLGASSATAEEAAIRAAEAELIQNFVQRARQVVPTGRMVVAHQGQISNIRLQDGDIITIPSQSDSLLISGEVLVPQAMIYVAGQRAEDYIRRAGGFTERADERNILVVRQNGEVVSASEVELRPGDEILVLPVVPTKNLQLASTLAQIIYHIAVAARVALNI
ncbi:polysaccharide export protein [Thioalkalivibrio sulfidiphilus HL-EbGr7]|uniref:Polysaccharide export protein n=2 Tax=Thioalkalivibrio TaxID=106633 RepID=B8GQX3_THISH|nr:polysaccharide export protein [Thioalkalivibrio sulfidiphilus HL-EbGr7]